MRLTLRDDLIDEAFDIKGILGLDFLLCTGAIINLGTLQLGFKEL